MKLNQTYFDFELTDAGWRLIKALKNISECTGGNERIASDATPGDSLALIRVTEFSHDDRPDIWYKPELVYLCLDKSERAAARERFKKYGLPEMLKQTCWADRDDLRRNINAALEDEIIIR